MPFATRLFRFKLCASSWLFLNCFDWRSCRVRNKKTRLDTHTHNSDEKKGSTRQKCVAIVFGAKKKKRRKKKKKKSV